MCKQPPLMKMLWLFSFLYDAFFFFFTKTFPQAFACIHNTLFLDCTSTKAAQEESLRMAGQRMRYIFPLYLSIKCSLYGNARNKSSVTANCLK